jgi:5-formyltetrahydrofolate cyclo-ligase
MEKAAVRRVLRDVVVADVVARSEEVCDVLRASLISFEGLRSVGLYAAMRGEPNLSRLSLALSKEYAVCYPRVLGEEMQFRRVEDVRNLQNGRWGIDEPVEGAPVVDNLDLIICPGVAFTRGGLRLGRGKGFYDRYIEGLAKKPVLWGVQYAERIKSTLPHESHDVMMDRVFVA